MNIFLCGTLADHRRGRLLQEAIGAQIAMQRPTGSALCLMFASEFQEADEAWRRAWIAWAETPGCALLLVPPFATGECLLPVVWEAVPLRDAKPTAERSLARLLASEVRYELRSNDLQIARDIGGLWDDYAINTAFYRKHPHAGVVVLTCLPLWSLTVLDHAERLRAWLDGVYALAGTPSPAAELAAVVFTLARDHYTVLLHVLSGRFADRAAALAALATSPIFKLEADTAARCYDELAQQELLAAGQVTERGREALWQSPYAAFADEMEMMLPSYDTN